MSFLKAKDAMQRKLISSSAAAISMLHIMDYYMPTHRMSLYLDKPASIQYLNLHIAVTPMELTTSPRSNSTKCRALSN